MEKLVFWSARRALPNNHNTQHICTNTCEEAQRTKHQGQQLNRNFHEHAGSNSTVRWQPFILFEHQKASDFVWGKSCDTVESHVFVLRLPNNRDAGLSSSERAPEVRGSLEVTARLSELSSLVEAHMGKSRSRALAKAMMDRCLLEEAESSERALAGCKHILFKYSRCQNFYMEIILKLVGVALVSVVNNNDCLRLCMAITLLMAAVSGMLQPFLQPQAGQKKLQQTGAP